MSTYALSATPLDLVIGRPFSLPLSYKDAGGSTDTTGLAIDAALSWPGQAVPLVPMVEGRADAAGTASLVLSASDAATVPAGLLSTLRVTYTDGDGATDDRIYLVNGVRVLAGDTSYQSPPATTPPAQQPSAADPVEQSYPIPITAPGQTRLPISPPPNVLSTLVLTVNGIDYRAPLALSATALAITWTGDFLLDPSDDVHVSYF